MKEIKKGDVFIDKWGRQDKCCGFGGNLAHTTYGIKTNEWGISSKVDLIKKLDGEYINIGNIKEIISNSSPARVNKMRKLVI